MKNGSVFCVVFFFFQAEDGIRDDLVTGVQTCALPIWHGLRSCVAESMPAPESETVMTMYEPLAMGEEIGRASCRERVWMWVGVVGGRGKNDNNCSGGHALVTRGRY